MSPYINNPQALRALVRPREVHRALYLDPALFDLEMRQYGPEGDPGRELLRRDLVWAHEQFWGDDETRAAAYDASYKAMSDIGKFFDSLDPKTDAQKQLLQDARRNYAFIGENRLLMSMQTSTPHVS